MKLEHPKDLKMCHFDQNSFRWPLDYVLGAKFDFFLNHSTVIKALCPDINLQI